MLRKILIIAFFPMIISSCVKDYTIVKEDSVKNDFKPKKLVSPGMPGYYDESDNVFRDYKIILK